MVMPIFCCSSGSGEEVVHEGLKLHATGGWHKAVGTSMAGVMWYVVHDVHDACYSIYLYMYVRVINSVILDGVQVLGVLSFLP